MFSKRISNLKNLSCVIRLKILGLKSSEQRRKYIDLVWLYKIFQCLSSISPSWTWVEQYMLLEIMCYVIKVTGYVFKKYNSSAILFGFTYRSVKLWN